MFKIETIKLSKKCGYTASEFAQEMVEYQGKMKCIGSGCYASVYSDKDHNYVYKITEDTAYLEFVRMLSKQPKQNPYFPIIHAARIIKSHDYHGADEVLVVCMERLKSLSGNNYHHYPEYAINRLILSFPEEVQTFCKLLQIDADLSKALYQLSLLRRTKRLDVDLHENNVMLRGKQLVFTDPFVG